MKCCRAFICAFLICILCTGCNETGYTTHRGVYAESASEDNVIILDIDREAEYVFLKDKSNDTNLFNPLDTGDKIEIKIVLINETDGVSWADAFECRKLSGVSAEELDKEHLDNINVLAEAMRTSQN